MHKITCRGVPGEPGLSLGVGQEDAGAILRGAGLVQMALTYPQFSSLPPLIPALI